MSQKYIPEKYTSSHSTADYSDAVRLLVAYYEALYKTPCSE